MPILDKVSKDATTLLAVLLVAHLVVVSLNRAPGRTGSYIGQGWLMTLYWPIQFVTTHGVGSFRYTWNHYLIVRDARVENDQLRKQVATMQQQVQAAEDKAKVAERLDTYVKWRSSQNYPALDANVIARDANQWFNTIVIDQGTTAGVQKDMPVVTPDGLVGRVIVTAPTASRVLLLTDERHGAGSFIGQLLTKRSLGVVRGKSAALCEMSLSVAADSVPPNEIVITSGFDGIYPRGLTIGRVRLAPGAAGVAPSVEVVPAARLDQLEMVAVLQVPRDQIRSKLDDLERVEKERAQAEKAPLSRNR
ncbi:MAG: rod shape-determining protein MreC [Acidobacteria bacterium]|nr:rod shape-determining protein MreC [Acidobacteriota bacterium]